MNKICLLLCVMTAGLGQAAPAAEDAKAAAASAKNPKLASAKALYLSAVFGQDASRKMLIVVDESKGTGKGYDQAYVDENLDGDLTNDAPKAFQTVGSGEKKTTVPRFSFKGPGPGKDAAAATYELYLYMLRATTGKSTATKVAAPAASQRFMYWLKNPGGWDYLFISGSVQTYPSSAEALAGKPIHLGGPCTWSVNLAAAKEDGQTSVSVGCKDTNGCTLRSVTAAGKASPTPTLTLLDKSGKELVPAKTMAFG